MIWNKVFEILEQLPFGIFRDLAVYHNLKGLLLLTAEERIGETY